MSAQRYRPGIAHERMEQGSCPECGRAPQMHGDDSRFWVPINQDCDLLEGGVKERIAQYREDQKTTQASGLGEQGENA